MSADAVTTADDPPRLLAQASPDREDGRDFVLHVPRHGLHRSARPSWADAAVDSAVQMTKIMADGMLEMARYSGPAGAKFMWASIPGLNADRADLDLLDVTIGTFKDASAAVGKSQLGAQALLGATSFNIPMWNGRGNTSPTAAGYALGHAAGGPYLPLNDPST